MRILHSVNDPVVFEDGSRIVALITEDSEIEIPHTKRIWCNIVRLDAQGEIVWFIQAEPLSADEGYFNAPTLEAGKVLAVTYGGREYNIDPDTGAAETTGRWFK